MTPRALPPTSTRCAAPVPAWHARVERWEWSALARSVADADGRLVALWGAAPGERIAPSVSAAFAVDAGLVWAQLDCTPEGTYPDLAPLYAGAGRMQRAAADLCGLHAQGTHDTRPWLDHGVWGDGPPPLAARVDRVPAPPAVLPADYPFVRVEGDGVHEIPVGPVHAGIIEPGHFRFSVVGEKVLRLEERLGYTHKGIERRFVALPALQGHRLAGRVSGDSTVAYSWAYCMALESATGARIPARGAWLRALMLERERVANHLGDLGALGNDAGLAFGLAQFSRLREDWQRLSMDAFGHRFMMDRIEPGGVAVDPPARVLEHMCRQCDAIEREVGRLRQVYDEHAGLQDRFLSTGRVPLDLARRLGITGMAARASGIARDLRADHPFEPYDVLGVRTCSHAAGDVAARVAVRFDETLESLRLIREIATRLPAGEVRATLPAPARTADSAPTRGIGWIEGWRGEVLVALELGDDGQLLRCHPHDPSWQNWPVLEHAVIGNIVPDFPLINKSFNLSYSGHDL